MDTLAAAPAAVTPVVYGASDRPPRGDYSRGGSVQADYTCPQDWASYTPADHDTYKPVSYTHLTLPTNREV